jgi:hypothetical protein
MFFLIALYACEMNDCEDIKTFSKCANNPLCQWIGDISVDENSNGGNDEVRHGTCFKYPCEGRTQAACDQSICRWDSTNLKCLSSEPLAVTDCTRVGFCWYNLKCHNTWRDECRDYLTQTDCAANDAAEGYCYWNTYDESCYTYASSCSQYLGSGNDCVNKVTITGHKCYYYKTGSSYVCSNTRPSTCAGYTDSTSCGGNYDVNGNLCYWLSGTSTCTTQRTDCSYGTDNVGCALSYPGNICYPLYYSTTWHCSNTRPASGNCGYYQTANFCKYGTADGGNCYWIGGACVGARQALCSSYSSTDCTNLKTTSGATCYWYNSGCQSTPSECRNYAAADCNSGNVNSDGGACYLFEGRCNAAQQECEAYTSSADCAVGSPDGGCYWYGSGCHSELLNNCFKYTSKPDCTLGTNGKESCYWYNNACHKTRAPCHEYTDQDQCVRGTVGGQCWWYDPTGGSSPACYALKRPHCTLS